MIPQKTKKHKCSNYQNNFDKKDNNTEDQKNVLILPPILLQKLGINLEYIQSSNGCTSNTKIGDSSKSKCSKAIVRTERLEEIVEKIYLPNESSIIETANLMKASVFLSPTFADTKTSLDVESTNSEMSVDDISPKSMEIIRTDNQMKHYSVDADADEFREEEEEKDNCTNIQSNYNKKGNSFEIELYSEKKLKAVMDREESVNENIGSVNNGLECNKVSTLLGEVQGYENLGMKVVSTLVKNDTTTPTMDFIVSINNNTINKNTSTFSHVDHKFDDCKRDKDLNEGHALEVVTFLRNFDEERHNKNNTKTNSPNMSDDAYRIEELQDTKKHIENKIEQNSSQVEPIILGIDKQLLLDVPIDNEQNDMITNVNQNSRITLNSDTNFHIPPTAEHDFQNERNITLDDLENNFPNERKVTLNNKNSLNDNEEPRINKHLTGNDNINCQIAKDTKAVDKQDNLNSSHKLPKSVNNSNTESNVSLGKVKEIAYYLGQHLYAEHNRNYDMGKTKKNTQHKRNSKLSIQGVEKPGGNIKITYQNNPVKTYSKGKRTKSSNIAAITSQEGYIKDIAIDYNIDDKYLESMNCRNFCLCEDFGSFSHYDSDENYEHIHFWEQKHVHCSTETLFNVYQDNFEHNYIPENSMNIDDTQGADNENQLDISDDTVFNICWSHGFNNRQIRNVIEKYKIQECYQEIENMHDKKCVGDDNSKFAQVDAKFNKCKRKWIDNTSDIESDYENKSARNAFEPTVTCRACNKKLSKHDWDSHISKGHCSIAWKNGQEIETDTEVSTEIVLFLQSEDDNKHIEPLDRNQVVSVLQLQSETRQFDDVPQLLKIKTNQIGDKSQQIKENQTHLECFVLNEVDDNIIEDHLLKYAVDSMPQMRTEEKQAIERHPLESAVDNASQKESKIKQNAKEHGLDCARNAFPQTEENITIKEHVSESAVEIRDTQVSDIIVLEVDTEDKYVTCAVCREVLLDSLWFDHITRKHNYIAWKDGDTPLDCTNEDNVRHYLNSVIKEIGELVCAGCGLKRKFAKLYLKHIKKCQSMCGDVTNTEGRIMDAIDVDTSAIDLDSEKNLMITDIQVARKCRLQGINAKNFMENEIKEKQVVGELVNEVDTGVKDVEKIVLEVDTADKYVTCAICQKQLLEALWMEHISKKHNYIAWKDGDVPLDTTSEDMVRDYLNNVIKEIGELVCKICGLKRKFAKSFLKHIKNCQSMKRKRTDNASDVESDYDQPIVKKTYESPVKCGVCDNKVPIYNWTNHISQEHCFIAWKNGQKLDLNSNDLMRNLRKILRDNNELICTFCKLKKYDVNDFIKHVKKCKRKLHQENVKDKHTEIVIEIPAVNVGLEQATVEKRLLEGEADTGFEEVADKIMLEVDTDDTYVTCAICRKIIRESLWVKHISRKHDYIGWRDGEEPLDCTDEEMMIEHFNYVIREIGGIICKKCGLKRKFAKSYLKHIKNCQSMEESDEESIEQNQTRVIVKRERVKIEDINIKCGVCQLELKNSQWMNHIFEEHDYLAWKEDDLPLDLNDSKQVYNHLFALARKNDGLTCKKCGCCRKYVKTYMKHVETCNGETGTVNNSTLNDSQDDTVDATCQDLSDDEDANVTCGVCKMDVKGKNWLNHIQIHHGYLAWKEGKLAPNLDDDEEINNYLYLMCKKYNGLVCNKCGLLRKYVKLYLSHIESCDSNLLNSSMIGSISDQDSYECGVCAEIVDARDWKSHAIKNHYNIAWAVGEYPIDVKNPSAVEKCLKEYKQLFGKLVCKICDTTRVSLMGFYAHIIQCGKTEEEMNQYKIFCEICKSKYLCIYKHQHATMHREQEYAREKKTLIEEQQKEMTNSVKIEPISERRRAAEKAREFIAKAETFAHVCSQCGFGADDQTELDEHNCSKIQNFSDTEDLVIPESSGDESVETVVESNLSEQEEEDWREERKRKKYSDCSSIATRVPRVPFTVNCPKTYLKESAEDYRKNYLTKGVLFSQWRKCKMELVLGKQIANYMPTVKESCNVILGRGDHETYRQFEAKKDSGLSIFVGGSIQCISWAPPHVEDENDLFGHYLAVACNSNFDSNRFDWDKTYENSGLLQIWNFGDLYSTIPELALGIAHDYGTIWAIDWCPSGVRDKLISPELDESITKKIVRLGLLAVACSNGSAYIFSVPYPSSLRTRDKIVFKFTPVAELKLSRGEREVFQATSISWSKQNKHETVVVGYSDGTIALYNLDCDSPLLMDRKSGVDIFYPYQDERPHNSSIADVQTFPSSEGSGIISCVSPTGSVQRHGSASVYGHLSSTSSAFAPHWPALMLSGNEAIVNQAVNELDWWGFGRRTGSVQACCGCWQCGHMAMFTPPVLRIMTTHPVYSDFNKEPIAVFEMRQLSKKRTRMKNDDLQLKLEPLSYNDAVKVYALDFKMTKDLNKEAIKQINEPRKPFPERFPLSDVSSMAFYPSVNHHRKLAVATHAGIVFIITV